MSTVDYNGESYTALCNNATSAVCTPGMVTDSSECNIFDTDSITYCCAVEMTENEDGDDVMASYGTCQDESTISDLNTDS